MVWAHVRPFSSLHGQKARSGRCCVVVRCEAQDFSRKQVIILGGTGVVGSSTAEAMLMWDSAPQITLSGRTQLKYNQVINKRPALKDLPYQECDVSDLDSVKRAIQGKDLVIHVAGPFQRNESFHVIQACIECGVPYIDDCDDAAYSQGVQCYHDAAVAAGVPAITTTGIYPGLSNIMAAVMVESLRGQLDKGLQFTPPPANQKRDVEEVILLYYTAGTGNIGPTILETSFLLCGEAQERYEGGQKVQLEPLQEVKYADFGPVIERRYVVGLNLPEVHSLHHRLGLPTVAAYFSTRPFFWLAGMWLMARLVPRRLLTDRAWVRDFVTKVTPVVRGVDKISGEAVAIRVNVLDSEGRRRSSVFRHQRLSRSVGFCIAGFAGAVLGGETEPGVWYPEDRQAVKDRLAYLRQATRGGANFQLNKPPFQIDAEPNEVTFGMYV